MDYLTHTNFQPLPTDQLSPAPTGRFRWTICALIFTATTINYLDRQVLSLLAPDLSRRFGWSNTDYANITAVFQFAYALSMVLGGRLIDRLGTKSGYAWAIIIWSVGAMLHAVALQIGAPVATTLAGFGWTFLTPSIAGFMLARIVLAIGESANFPAAVKATAEYFPRKERSLATGIFNSGTTIGAILAPLTVPWLSVTFGWEAAFVLIGITGFLWLFFWLRIYEVPERQPRLSPDEWAYIQTDTVEKDTAAAASESVKPAAWFQLLGYRQTWAFIIGKMMTDGVWWFFLFWLPKYLEAQYGMVNQAIVWPLALLYSLTMIGSIGGGWLPGAFMKTGLPTYEARMRAMLLIAFFPLVVLLAQPLGQYTYWIPVLLIGIGASAHQAWSANLYTTVSDMFPKKAVASVIGIGGMAGGLGGVLVSKTGGALFDHYKSLGHIQTGYTIMFSFCGLAYLIAWVLMKTLVPRFKPIGNL